MALDGLGLVAQGENSGAAVHREMPNYRPLDEYVNNLQAQLYQTQLQKAKEKQQLLKNDADIFNLKLEGWDRDRKAELMKMDNAIRQEYSKIRSKGINANDYTNPEALKFQEHLSTFKNAMQVSGQHMQSAQKALQALQADNLTDNPTYDYEKSKERFLKEYAELPISERIGKNPEDFFVRKEKPFDSYFLLNDDDDKFKIDPFTSKYSTENEEYMSSGNKLSEKELVTDITSRANNPKYKEKYEQGLNQGLWSNKSEFVKYNVDRAKLLFQPETKYEKKAPKQVSGWNMDFINGTGINDLLKASGSSETQYNVPNYFSQSGKQASGDGKAPAVVKTTFPQSYQLGNINVTIPTAAARDGSTGEPLAENGVINMTSGMLANGLVDKKTGNLIPIEKGKTNSLNINGKIYKGTADEVTRKLIQDGNAEYKPLLLGTVKIKDEIGTESFKSVIVDANSVVNRMTNKKGKDPLDDATAKLEVLNKAAASENGGGQNVLPISTIRSFLSNPDYAGYTEAELIKFYEDQGYKVTK